VQEGGTPLFWASFKGHAYVVDKLLARTEIDINKQNKVDVLLHTDKSI